MRHLHVVHGVHAPNGKELMDKILAAFHKVFAKPDRPWPTPTTRSIPARTASCTGGVCQTPPGGYAHEKHGPHQRDT